MIEELVQWTSSGESPDLDASNYRLYLELLKENPDIQSLRSQCAPLYKEVYILRRQQPSIRTLLNLAALQGVTLLDILLRPKESASRPLFNRSLDFEGIPFPAVSTPVAAKNVEKIVSRLMSCPDLLLPPLHLLCDLEKTIPFKYTRIYEISSDGYKKRYKNQRDIKIVGARAFHREFQSALHLVHTSAKRTKSRTIVNKIAERRKANVDLIERMVMSAREIFRVRSAPDH